MVHVPRGHNGGKAVVVVGAPGPVLRNGPSIHEKASDQEDFRGSCLWSQWMEVGELQINHVHLQSQQARETSKIKGPCMLSVLPVHRCHTSDHEVMMQREIGFPFDLRLRCILIPFHFIRAPVPDDVLGGRPTRRCAPIPY